MISKAELLKLLTLSGLTADSTGESLPSPRETPVTITKRVTPEKIVAPLSPEALATLKELLEANREYNHIFYQQYLDAPSSKEADEITRILWKGAINDEFERRLQFYTDLGKRTFKEEYEFFSEQLQLLETSLDQQRTLDDIYEYFRYQLSIAERHLTPTLEMMCLNVPIKQFSLDIFREFIQKLAPFISEFQKNFQTYSRLIPTCKTTTYPWGFPIPSDETQSSYQLETPRLIREVLQQLTKIETLYVTKQHSHGIKSIRAAKTLILSALDEEGEKYTHPKKGTAQNNKSIEDQRGKFYFLTLTLTNAKREYNQFLKAQVLREQQAKLQEDAPKQTHTKPDTSGESLKPRSKFPAESVPSPSFLPPSPAPALPPQPAPPPVVQPATKTTSKESEDRPAGTPLLYAASVSAKARRKGTYIEKSKANDQDKKTQRDLPSQEISEHPKLTKVMDNKKFTKIFTQLFSESLSQVKITKLQIIKLLEAFDCTVKETGIRVVFSYKGKIGFGFTGTFHVVSQDKGHGGKKTFLHSIALRHVKNFLERIGAKPKPIPKLSGRPGK